MDKADIERYLNSSRGHSIIVDVRDVEQAPGNVRTVTIHDGNEVTIEYDRARAYVEGDSEGGGLKYIGKHQTLDDLLRGLEMYLGKSLDKWLNFTATPFTPSTLDDPDPQKSLEYFENLVRRQAVPLPTSGTYKIAGVYWRHIAKYGEYRQDKLLEEQDEELDED